MILLSTAEARVVHAVLEFGPGTVGLLSENDKAHLAKAKAKLGRHVMAFMESEVAARVGTAPKEPA